MVSRSLHAAGWARQDEDGETSPPAQGECRVRLDKARRSYIIE